MGKKDKHKIVTLVNVPMNTDDQQLKEYFEKFGTIEGEIRRQHYKDGPLIGLENGTRTNNQDANQMPHTKFPFY